MTFKHFEGEQRSPEWFALRLGKVTASRLEDWLAVSKAKASLGKPLKPRLDYERELVFERQFGVSFTFFTTPAMQQGIDFEDYARDEYVKLTGNKVEQTGAFYNDYFVASPDGLIGKDGMLEIKVVGDNSFADILANGVPSKYWKQMQGQMWAADRKWCDFWAINLSTRRGKLIRVTPDKEFQEWLELAIPEPVTVPEYEADGMFELPDDPFPATDTVALGEPTTPAPSEAITNLKAAGF